VPLESAEQERWAEALAVERAHGEHAQRHVAERVCALALAGDDLGVRRWREIAVRLDRLAESVAVQ
jgi:hypothetical protein